MRFVAGFGNGDRGPIAPPLVYAAFQYLANASWRSVCRQGAKLCSAPNRSMLAAINALVDESGHAASATEGVAELWGPVALRNTRAVPRHVYAIRYRSDCPRLCSAYLWLAVHDQPDAAVSVRHWSLSPSVQVIQCPLPTCARHVRRADRLRVPPGNTHVNRLMFFPKIGKILLPTAILSRST